MLCSQYIFMKDLGDDFADVDFCEELCYHSRPKKQNYGGGRRKSARREDCGNRKRVSAMPQTAALSASVALFGKGKSRPFRRISFADFSSIRLLRRVPVSGGAQRRRLYIYGATPQGHTRTKPHVNRILTATEKQYRKSALFGVIFYFFGVLFQSLSDAVFSRKNVRKF